MTDELKSRSQIQRALTQNPGEVIKEIETLRTALAAMKKQLVIAELECERLGKGIVVLQQANNEAYDREVKLREKTIPKLKEENQSLRRALTNARGELFHLHCTTDFKGADLLSEIDEALKHAGEK